MKTRTLLAALAAAALASAASAQSTHTGHGAHGSAGSAGTMPNMAPRAADTASTKDFKDAHMRMMKNMDQPFTGDPDIDFRVHMIPHHPGAVDMAKVALKHAKDPETKKMAQKIVDDQEKEIGEMQAWLKKHGH
jgi:uncharacterized protein (DUF305 family)